MDNGKVKTHLSPTCKAAWAKTVVSGDYAGKDQGYSIELLCDLKDETQLEWLKSLREKYQASKKKFKPYKAEKDKESGKPTGRYLVIFKSKYPIRTIDSQCLPVNGKTENYIGNDSLVKIAYREFVYDNQFGGGFQLWAETIQILKLIEHKPATPKEQGFTKVANGYANEDNPFDVSDDEFDVSDEKEQQAMEKAREVFGDHDKEEAEAEMDVPF